jgi:hypothetical protein
VSRETNLQVINTAICFLVVDNSKNDITCINCDFLNLETPLTLLSILSENRKKKDVSEFCFWSRTFRTSGISLRNV